MKTKLITITLISLAGVLILPSLVFSQQPDTTPPELLNFDFNPKVIDTSNNSQDVEFTVEAKDDLSGMGTIEIWLEKETAPGLITGYPIAIRPPIDEEGKTPQEGIFKTIYSFPQYFPEGIWYVGKIHLTDRPEGYGSNAREITINELKERGFPTELQVISQPQPDTTPPELLDFDFNPKTIDTSNSSQEVEFVVEVRDDLSSLGVIDIWLEKETAPGLITGYPIAIRPPIDENSGTTPQEGIFSTTYSFPRYFPEGIWDVEKIVLYDQPEGYGQNCREITKEELKERGFPTELEVISQPQPDTIPPELLNFDFNPKAINTFNSSQEVEFVVEARDNLSPISPIEIELFGQISDEMGIGFIIVFRPPLPPPQEGVFRTTYTLPRYFPEGIWYVRGIYLCDQPEGYGQNCREITKEELKERGFPTELEVISQPQPPVAEFTFSNSNPKTGEEIILDASDSYDPDGAIIYYEWDLDGDGEDIKYEGWTTNPEIVYYWIPSGTYYVTLKVTDNNGLESTTTKVINVIPKHWWEDINWPWSEKVKKISDENFEEIKENLIDNCYCRGGLEKSGLCDELCSATYYPKFYNDKYIRGLLNKEIDFEEIPGLTYGIRITDTLHDIRLVNSIAGDWTGDKETEKYFSEMANINVWAELAQLMSQETFVGLIEVAPVVVGGSSVIAAASAIGATPIFMLIPLSKIYEGLKLLNETFFRRALWHYFQVRSPECDPDCAFNSIPVSMGDYYNNTTKEYFESLWSEYKGYLSSSGLDEDFKQRIKEGLRATLLSAFEKYKFESEDYIVSGIKSPGELRVYDSQGNVTGLINGEIREEIPNSVYDEENKTVIIFDPFDTYRYEVIGTETGTYGLDIISVENWEATTFTAIDIPASAKTTYQYTIDWDVLSQGGNGVTLQIDADGDGIFEQTVTADNDLTYDEFILQTGTIIDFDPDTLNLKSKGKFVTVYIELPQGFDVSQIDISSIMLNDLILVLAKPTKIGDYDNDGTPDLMVEFDRSGVQGILSPGDEVPLILTGRILHNGNYIDFKGSDLIRVINKGNGK